MFSKADAKQLRQNLRPIEFLHSDGEVGFELGANAVDSYSAYAEFYGLNFTESAPDLRATRASIGTFHSGGYELVCQHFLPPEIPPRRTAFLLHGYFDHAGLYRHLISHLLRRGIAVVIFDLPGHGLSSGAPARITSFQEYSDAFVACLSLAVREQLAAPWLVIGQSTGGAIIMDALLEKKLEAGFVIQDFILLGPLLRPKHWSRSKILFSLSRLFLTSTPRNFSKNSHDAEFLEFLESHDELQSRLLPRDWVQAMIDYISRFIAAPKQQQPLHIVQGKGDGTVDWETNIPAILEKFPGSEVHWIEEAGHHLVNESLPYREKVFATIDRVLDSQQAAC
ncbi:MAG: alpha/beta hydrolase [Pseudohongiellaceae bacterium]